MNNYERAHIRDIAIRNQRISHAVDDAMTDIARRFTTVKGRRFARVLNNRLSDLHDQIVNNGNDGIRNQWLLANKMNNANIDGYLANVKISDTMYKSFRNPNLSALNAFIDRTEAGMNLSDRVWNFTGNVQTEMERLISQGVLEGKSAIELSKELKQYVKGRPIHYGGTLIPGRNLKWQAIRLAATEMNMAFRTSDYLQNSNLPFVTGVRIDLSPAHPTLDICDELVGDYPKGFLFTGWHPCCICYATWDTLPKEEFVDYIKTGEINQDRFTTSIPGKAQHYLDKNGARLLGYKDRPYWLRDNFTDKLTLRDTVQKPIVSELAKITPNELEFNTTTEADTWLSDNGYITDFTIKNVKNTLKLQTDVANDLNQMYRRYPEIAKRIENKRIWQMHLTGEKSLNIQGLITPEGCIRSGIYDSKRRAIDVALGTTENMKESISIGKFRLVQGGNGTIRHEIGHHVFDNCLTEAEQGEWKALYDSKAKSFVQNKLSEYGAANCNEGFSETFSAFTSRTYKTGILPKDIESYFTKLFK